MNPFAYEEPDRAISKLLRDALKRDGLANAEIEVRPDGGTVIRYYYRSGKLKAQYTVVVWENVRPPDAV